MSDSYSAPSNGLLRKFSSKSNEILIKFAQIFILTIFKLLKAQYNLFFLASYWLFLVTYSLLLVT